MDDKENIRVIDGVEHKLRSLAELDEVIDEIMERNPWFKPAINKVVEDIKKEQLKKKK